MTDRILSYALIIFGTLAVTLSITAPRTGASGWFFILTLATLFWMAWERLGRRRA